MTKYKESYIKKTYQDTYYSLYNHRNMLNSAGYHIEMCNVNYSSNFLKNSAVTWSYKCDISDNSCLVSCNIWFTTTDRKQTNKSALNEAQSSSLRRFPRWLQEQYSLTCSCFIGLIRQRNSSVHLFLILFRTTWICGVNTSVVHLSVL